MFVHVTSLFGLVLGSVPAAIAVVVFFARIHGVLSFFFAVAY